MSRGLAGFAVLRLERTREPRCGAGDDRTSASVERTSHPPCDVGGRRIVARRPGGAAPAASIGDPLKRRQILTTPGEGLLPTPRNLSKERTNPLGSTQGGSCRGVLTSTRCFAPGCPHPQLSGRAEAAKAAALPAPTISTPLWKKTRNIPTHRRNRASRRESRRDSSPRRSSRSRRRGSSKT